MANPYSSSTSAWRNLFKTMDVGQFLRDGLGIGDNYQAQSGINYAYDKRYQSPANNVKTNATINTTTNAINYKYDTRYQNAPGQALTPSQLEARNKIINSPVTTTTRGPSSNTDEWRAYVGGVTQPKTFDDYLKRLGLYGNNTDGNGGAYGYSGIGGIGQFKPSQAYLDAMNYTNQLLGQLNSGRTSYSDKINEMMGKIENRDKFQYDMDKDPLFQQYLNSSMQKGKVAMQDTIGQASALTGGYGSTYATAAANGAYNQFIQDAYDNVSDYYGMALDTYNQEGQELYNQLGMYQNADATEYSRLANAYSMNLANAQNMYSQEYSNYWDTANYNQSAAQFNAQMKYKYDAMAQDQKNYQTELAWKQYQQMLGNSTSSASGTNGTEDTQLKSFLTATNNKNTLQMLENLYFQHGSAFDSNDTNAPATKFDDELSRLYEQGYDIDEIYNYINQLVGGSSYELTDKHWPGDSDNEYTVTLPSGGQKVVSYAELQELLKKYPNLIKVKSK